MCCVSDRSPSDPRSAPVKHPRLKNRKGKARGREERGKSSWLRLRPGRVQCVGASSHSYRNLGSPWRRITTTASDRSSIVSSPSYAAHCDPGRVLSTSAQTKAYTRTRSRAPELRSSPLSHNRPVLTCCYPTNDGTPTFMCTAKHSGRKTDRRRFASRL